MTDSRKPPISRDPSGEESQPTESQLILDHMRSEADPEARRANLKLTALLGLGGLACIVVVILIWGVVMRGVFGGSEPPIEELEARTQPRDQGLERLRSSTLNSPTRPIHVETGGPSNALTEASEATEDVENATWAETLRLERELYLRALNADPVHLSAGSSDSVVASASRASDIGSLRSRYESAEATALATLEDLRAATEATLEASTLHPEAGATGLEGIGGDSTQPANILSGPASPFRLDDELHAREVHHADPLEPPVWALTPGTQIAAVLMTDYDSSQPSLVVAQVRRPVLSPDGRHELIPAGTLVLGESASGLPQQARSGFGRMEALVFPDRTIVEVPGWAPTDLRGHAGIPGKVKTHFWKAFGAATMLGVLGGVFADATDRNQVTFTGVPTDQHISSEVAREYQTLANRILDRWINLPATVEASAGTRMTILVQQVFDLGKPYRAVEG